MNTLNFVERAFLARETIAPHVAQLLRGEASGISLARDAKTGRMRPLAISATGIPGQMLTVVRHWRQQVLDAGPELWLPALRWETRLRMQQHEQRVREETARLDANLARPTLLVIPGDRPERKNGSGSRIHIADAGAMNRLRLLDKRGE